MVFFSLEELDILGCDRGTVNNSGYRTRVIRCIELQGKRLLQPGVCLLHLNDLSFRHLLQILDCEMIGLESYSGPIVI